MPHYVSTISSLCLWYSSTTIHQYLISQECIFQYLTRCPHSLSFVSDSVLQLYVNVLYHRNILIEYLARSLNQYLFVSDVEMKLHVNVLYYRNILFECLARFRGFLSLGLWCSDVTIYGCFVLHKRCSLKTSQDPKLSSTPSPESPNIQRLPATYKIFNEFCLELR